MQVRLLSDLHLEFQNYAPPASNADVVVLAGDIHTRGRGVSWAKTHFGSTPVVYVPGNHEYYDGSLGHTWADMAKEAEGSNVHLLNDQAIVLCGVRFVGATLWTDFRLSGNQPLAEWDALQTLKDYKFISDEGDSKIRPESVLRRHEKSRSFIEEELNRPFSGKTFVVTHHAPCELSISERFRRNATSAHLNAAYASRLEHLMGSERVAVWAHGHTHDSFDYDVFGTRIICNPRGYAPKEVNKDFKDVLLVEL